MFIDNIESFRTDIIHDIKISYRSGSKCMRLEYVGGNTANIKRGDTVELNGDLSGGCLTAEGESILIYFIHKLLFEVIQARRTVSGYEKRIETGKILEEVDRIALKSRQKEIDDLKEKNESITTGYNGAMEKIRQLEKENENLRIEINTGFDKRIVLQNQIAGLNTQNANLRESLRKAERKADSLSKAAINLCRKNRVLSTAADKLRRKNGVLCKENDNLRRHDLAQKRVDLKEPSYKKDRPKTYVTGWAEDISEKAKKPNPIRWFPIHLMDTREKRKILVRFHNKKEYEDRVFLCSLITCPDTSPDMLFIEAYTRVNLTVTLKRDGFEPVQYALPELPEYERSQVYEFKKSMRFLRDRFRLDE